MGQFQGTMPWRIVAVSKAGEDEPRLAQDADCSYWCEHQTLYYRLDSGKANEYYLPDPVCVDCKKLMVLDTLFGDKTSQLDIPATFDLMNKRITALEGESATEIVAKALKSNTSDFRAQLLQALRNA